ncbi:pyruvate dehydrogenase E1 component alpha subunit [Deinobacterium chartae]|uniref:Pyruvate dehydrogenase E1 component subunit alpha n=1 Tax=Deinobacterium chartae TaxID=521158 RepID=A0A841I3M9_9DEIO|nr:pyruvate dehydrogenase (acetyl-transferring) E1 component subunit alpha [Deinobacterium chartae]MBB6099020.1 pyruvate dehydrogenase E1 component alpha subunit [Deinobacterium chartae]
MSELLQIIGPGGEAVRPELLPEPALLEQLYRAMRRIRHFDERAVILHRQGRMGVYPPFGGMEASQAGSALALRRSDWLFPTYRDSGAALTYGMPIERCIAYWRTSPHGWSMPEDLKLLPFYVPIATQYPHAVGAALAEKMRGTDNVAMAFIGDGGSSEGDFHEALNFAGALNAPVVFMLQNNGWAISVPTSTQTKATDLSLRAQGYGIPGVRVDGNDIVAVYHAALEAVTRARSGEGPTLIETVTYRVKPHTVSDDPGRYRTEEATRTWLERDPVRRLKTFLEGRGLWSEEREVALEAELMAEFEQAVERADAFPEPEPVEILEHVFKEPTPALRRQREQILEELRG